MGFLLNRRLSRSELTVSLARLWPLLDALEFSLRCLRVRQLASPKNVKINAGSNNVSVRGGQDLSQSEGDDVRLRVSADVLLEGLASDQIGVDCSGRRRMLSLLLSQFPFMASVLKTIKFKRSDAPMTEATKQDVVALRNSLIKQVSAKTACHFANYLA
jgi:hypothetical protein